MCLMCGAPFRQLPNTHLRSHALTALAYKKRFGYTLRRGLMGIALRRLYSDRAIRRGLAAAIRHRPIVSDPDVQRRGGIGPMALEESLTRREGWLRRKGSTPVTALSMKQYGHNRLDSSPPPRVGFRAQSHVIHPVTRQPIWRRAEAV